MTRKPERKPSHKPTHEPANRPNHRPDKPAAPTRDLRRDPPFEIAIDDITAVGEGEGEFKRARVQIPFTIPGERVLAQPITQRGEFVHALGVRLLDASADRVYPVCAHFGMSKCAHCDWQHMDYAAQVALKQDMLITLLERARIANPPVRPVIAAPLQWGYNHHMTFTVVGSTPLEPDAADQPNDSPDADDDDKPLSEIAVENDAYLAFPARRDTPDDRDLIRIRECHILHPDLFSLYQQLDMDLSNLRRVRLQQGSDGDQMLVLTAFTDAAPALETDLPVSINLILPDNEPLNLIGESHSRFEVNKRILRATAGSFFRPNISALPNLIDSVITLLDPQPDDAVLDLFAGVGVFSAFIAPRVRVVSMIESYPPAVTDADDNLADFENVDVYEGGVDTVLEDLLEADITDPDADEESGTDESPAPPRYTAAVIDPPHTGISDAALKSLVALGVDRIVLVSDEAHRLPRDVAQFKKAGYALTAVQPVDLAPQTAHIATVCLFTR